MERKPISLTGTGTSVWVVCNDGTLWHNFESGQRSKEQYWKQVPDVPQPVPNYGTCSVCRREQIGKYHEHPCE